MLIEVKNLPTTMDSSFRTKSACKTENSHRQAATVPSKWAWHYRKLRTLHKDASKQLEEHWRTVVPFELPRLDSMKPGNDSIEHYVLVTELQNEGRRVSEINEAILRLADGTYGICQASGIFIEPERLRTVPWTRFCCAAADRWNGPTLRSTD